MQTLSSFNAATAVVLLGWATSANAVPVQGPCDLVRCAKGTACIAMGDEAACVPYEPPCICTEQYEPVCGFINIEDYFIRKTFGNNCKAKCNGATDVVDGECEKPTTRPALTPPVEMPEGKCETNNPPYIEYTDYCGKEVESTRCDCFESNWACKVVDYDLRPCPTKPTTLPPAPTPAPTKPACICTKEYIPVCGFINIEDYFIRKTFGNNCEAKCNGATDVFDGECEKPTTRPALTPPVEMPKGKCETNNPPYIEYTDYCGKEVESTRCDCFESNWACKVVDYDLRPCPTKPTTLPPAPTPAPTKPACICTEQYEPVCGFVRNAEESLRKTFGNKCKAKCDGATDVVDGECKTNPVTLSPVELCENSPTWVKKGRASKNPKKAKNCAWVAKKASRRCKKMGKDSTRASEGCAAACNKRCLE